MRKRLYRTVLSVAIVVAGVLAVRWTIRAAMTRAYKVERDVAAVEMPVVPAPRTYSLATLVHKDLHANVAGIPARRQAERMHMPYALAVDVADEKAKSANWERIDNPNALTVKNISGMERLYRTPTGSFVLREVRPVKGDDAIMEDLVLPAEMIPEATEQTSPDVLARRSARHVKELMPAVIRDVVIGSPMMTELIERGGGAALIVHCVADMPVNAVENALESAARKAGWTKTPFVDAEDAVAAAGGKVARSAAMPYHPGLTRARWSKANLTFCYDVATRDYGAGCDVNYRFTDDEVYIPTKGKTANEN